MEKPWMKLNVNGQDREVDVGNIRHTLAENIYSVIFPILRAKLTKFVTA
jgi:hypothetical protein